MPVYKDEKRNTWFCKCNYKDWLGESKSKMKRGFATKKDAQQWERDFLQKQSASMDMKFASFVDVYFEDKAPRLKERSIMTKRTLFETKIIPYFGEKQMNEITAVDIIKWQNALLNQDYKLTYLRMIQNQIKKANGGLPISLWDTYSSFANCYGGVIILGVKEEKDGSWKTTGLQNASKLRKEFWDNINNPQKVNINLLTEDNVETYEVGDNKDVIMVIYVPMAKREQKPVYINNDIFNGTFRRNYEGDYHCTRLQVKTMLRDQTERTMDMEVLDKVPMEDLNYDTIHGYRNSHRFLKEGHPFERLSDHEYLRSIGAAAISEEDGKLHPTAAGMLMFGDEYNIVRHFPEYFLDYREELDPTTRWSDRLQSSSGEWSGNVCDFYFRVYNKIIKDIKVPFKMVGGERIDDTPVHKALREALANCLINADYHGLRGVVIRKEPDKLILANPGYVRTGKKQMRLGGESDPRNKALMKMFNLINIGERAGSGVPNIFNVWADEGWEEPVIEERFDPDRTVLSLSFKKSDDKKPTIKSDDKKPTIKSDDKKSTKTGKQQEKILNHMEENKEYRLQDFCDLLGLKETRTKEILKPLISDGKISVTGKNKDRRYKLG